MEASNAPMAPRPPCWDLHEVQCRIHERLRLTAGRHDKPAVAADPAFSSFQRRLARHLQRMPARYLADVDADDKAEDVLLHWRILDECADPDKRPVFHARIFKIWSGYHGSGEELVKPCQRLTEGSSLQRKTVDDTDSTVTFSRRTVIHEVIFCSLDRPRLLCRVAALFDEVGLHILEGHLYCTVDGFCLAIFLVDGWETEETDGLIAKIKMTLALENQSNSTNAPISEKVLGIQQKLEILKLTGESANKGEIGHLDLLRTWGR